MLLIKGCIVYWGLFVDGAVVFDRVGQPSEFAMMTTFLYPLLTNCSISFLE